MGNGFECVDCVSQYLESQIKLLNTLNPKNILKKGYSIVSQNNKAIIKTKNINYNKLINVRMYKGNLKAKIVEIN